MQCRTISALWMPVFPLQYDNQKYFQTLSNVPRGTELPRVENYRSNLTKADFSQAKPNYKVRNQERVARGGGREIS